MLKYKIIIFFMVLADNCQGLNQVESKYWLVSCTLDSCSFAFNSCMNCFGVLGCKSCITLNKPECSVCVDDIYNKDDLETINGNQYLLCDSLDPMQSAVCHLYCRGQYAQSGQCTVENGLPICKCSVQSGTTNKPNKPPVYFNDIVKLNVSISSGYQRIMSLPNGDVVRGSSSNLVEIWDIQQGVIKRNLSNGYSKPWVFGLLSNGDLIAGFRNNKTLLTWDLKIENGQPLKNIIHTNQSFYCLTVLKNDYLAIGQSTNNFDIVIINSQNGSIKNKFVGHKNYVYQIIELENGNLVSCSSDLTVKIWDIKNGHVLKSISHSQPVWSIAFLKNGYLASGLSDGTIKIWNLETNQLVKNLYGHSSAICSNNCLHVLDNGDLLSGSYDKSLKVWNPDDGTVILTSKLHKSNVYQISVLPSGNILTSSFHELTIWN